MTSDTAAPKPSWLVDDWHWAVNHAWSMRLIMLAFVLSGAEVALPLFTDTTNIPRPLFASILAVVTGGAFVARLFAQKRPE
jgi:hypothetical protein